MTIEATIATLINRKALVNERIGVFCRTDADCRFMADLIISRALPGQAVLYKPSARTIEWVDGPKAFLFSSDEPDSIRGHQFDFAVAMDTHTWNGMNAFNNAKMSVHLGSDPEFLVLY